MRLIYLFWFAFLGIHSFSQVNFTELEGDHSFRVNSNGSLGVNLNNLRSASFYQEDTSKPLLRQAGLWIVAKDLDDKYHTATHYQSIPGDYDFWSGPMDTLTGETSTNPKWNNVWIVTREQIKTHQQDFDKSSYQLPKAISDWPAQGSDGFANYLAPFIDFNKNGIYDPENGDYPDIKGRKSAYCIFNDIQGEHQASKGQEIGIEIALMISEYSGSQKYLEYYIINRRSTSYSDIYTGFFLDGQCGNRSDNYAGTFEKYPHSIFIYNGDDYDENHFAESTPFVMATFLNKDLSSSIACNDGNGKNGIPTNNSDFINFAESKWKDSSDLTFGGDGTAEGTSADYIFSQLSPNENSFWTEELALNSPGGRTIIGFTQTSNFESKDFLKMDICLDAGIIQNDENVGEKLLKIASENFVSFRQSSSTHSLLKATAISFYPNPSNGRFKLECSDQIKCAQVSDSKGITVYSEKNINKNEIWCNILLSSGIYYIHVTTDEGTLTEKICVRL